jgi:putative spermidine/putrescine transport system substrate-binding protein
MRKHVLAASFVLLAGGDALAQVELVINSFGGAYEKRHRELVIEPFEKANNAKVTVVTVYSADMVAQLRAQKATPRFDVVHLSGGLEATAAAEGLLAPIRPDQLTNHADLYPFAVANLAKGEGPAYSAAVVGMLYDANKAKPAPTSWLDITNPAYGGHLVLTDLSNNWTTPSR